MSLTVVFRRAARAEFLDDSARYETLRSGLGAEFIAEIDRCIARWPTIQNNIPQFIKASGASPRDGFRTVFTFVLTPIAWWFWLFSMTAEIRWSGKTGFNVPASIAPA